MTKKNQFMSFSINRNSEQTDRGMATVEETDSEMIITIEHNGSSEMINSKRKADICGVKCNKNKINQKFVLDSLNTKEENAVVSESIAAKKMKLENNSPSTEVLPKVSDITKAVFELTEIKMEKPNCVVEIKVEKDVESEDISNILKGENYATLPEITQISVGEIKIEDCVYDKEPTSSEGESFVEKGGFGKLKYQVVSDDMSSGEENSFSAISKWKEENDLPTTSQKMKKEITDLKSIEKENAFNIKEETNHETDEDQEDMNSPSDDEEFLSDFSSGEKLLSDGDENNIDNQNLTVDNKAVVSQLIDEYHRRPQLWFKELSTEITKLNELQLFRSINSALSKKFNMKYNLNRVKTFLLSLCEQYEEEIERQLKENEETTAESSRLWFYDKLFFVKEDIENNVKLKLEKTVKVLDDNILADLIDIYKNYDDLWDTNKSAFPNRQKRHEALQLMCLEVKNKLKISFNTFKLELQLFNIHNRLKEEKQFRFLCEKNQREYKPSLPFIITKYEFLENHQEPFKCSKCSIVLDTCNKFRQHKAQHDGTPEFKCNICEKVCKSQSSFYFHSHSHNGINYNCSICGAKASFPQTLRKHIKLIHVPQTQGEIFSCNECGKDFDLLKKLEEHQKRIHEEEPIQCKICGETCKNKFYYKNHYSNHNHDGKNYDCSICKKGFTQPVYLKRHMMCVHKFNCVICNENCSDTKSLNQHMASHESKYFNCNICGKAFDHQNKMKEHTRKQHSQNEIECKICGKMCKNLERFNYHSLFHNDEKYDCNICGKSFLNTIYLDTHMITHDKQHAQNEIQYKICSKTSRNLKRSKYHSLINNLKKYDCNLCGKSFPNTSYLNMHIKTHDKKFQCRFCGNKFPLQYPLKKHMLVCKARDN